MTISSETVSSPELDRGQLTRIAEQSLTLATKYGATQAAVYAGLGNQQSIYLKCGEIEKLIHYRSQKLNITVFFGQRSGSVSLNTFSDEAVENAVASAAVLARYGDADPFAGLPDQQHLATDIRDLSLFDSQVLSVDEAKILAIQIEQAANTAYPGHCISESASVSSWQGNFIFANSAGFLHGYPSSLHTLRSQCIARLNRERQNGDWYLSQRQPSFLTAQQAKAVGEKAANISFHRLNPRKLLTGQSPVLFEASAAHNLIHYLVGALQGSNLYRDLSFLGRCIGEQVTSSHLTLSETPFIPGGLASAPFDGEGVSGSSRFILRNGQVEGYFLSSYSARRLGLSTTGNANGAYNLTISSDLTEETDDFSAMVHKLYRGLIVTSLLGDGLNPMTGNYSQGASGFWVENGEIQYPVAEITISGNIKTLLQQIVALGADSFTQGNLTCGSLLIEHLQIAGK